MTTANQLGAIELIELGSSRRESAGTLPVLRRPFLGTRQRPMIANRFNLGQLDFLGDIGSFLTGALQFVFENLASIIDLPLDWLSSGVGLLFDGLAGILVNVPIIGVLASQVLLLAKSAIQWGLTLPGELLGGIGDIFGQVKDAIDATRTDDEKKEDEKKAKEKILAKAEEKGGKELKDAVDKALGGKTPDNTINTPPTNDLPPGADEIGTSDKTDIEKVLEIGLPVAGAAALVFIALG